MTQIPRNLQGTDASGLLHPDSIKNWLRECWSGFIEGFETFGAFTGGIMGVYMVFRVLKFLVDTTVHGAVLYDLFGWSLFLLGAL
jgi:hypothetical protein